MRQSVYIFWIMCTVIWGCSNADVETALTHRPDHSQTVDSIAFGNIRFGMDRNSFLRTFAKPPVENKMSEPQFDEMVTEVEMPVTVGEFTYRGFYYFDKKERLYKIHMEYQNEKRLVKTDYNEAYENLYEDLKSKYGPGISLNTMPGLKSNTWIFKNKKIELTGSCLASNCSMECSIIETNMFKENTIQNRVKDARLHLELKLHPEKF
jgi:hypothetical protein